VTTDLKPLFKLINDFRNSGIVNEALAHESTREQLFRALAMRSVRLALASFDCRGVQNDIAREISAELPLILEDEINKLPETFFKSGTNLGWAYQILNASSRDANSWAISKRSDNKSEVVDIAAVTQIFTDDYIAEFLVDRCLTLVGSEGHPRRQIVTLCDPAVGTGHILISAVHALATRGLSAYEISQSLYGLDIDPIAVILARAALFSELVKIDSCGDPFQLWNEIGKRIREVPSPYGSLDRTLSMASDRECFDVVVANPPYLGKRKLPQEFRSFLDRDYPAASIDLCAAFMWRCAEIVTPGGALGIVTSDKWIRLDGYAGLRNGDGRFRGLLGELTLDGIYELGSRAFDAASDLHDGMRASILTGRRVSPSGGHEISYVNLSKVQGKEAKKKALSLSITATANLSCLTKVRQSEISNGGRVFLKTGGLPRKFVDLYQQVSDQAQVVVGVQTSDDSKFTRYVWRAPDNRDGWRLHCKGGGYARWAGFNRWIIDWSGGRAEFLGGELAKQRSEKWCESQGWLYTWFANGNLGVRIKESGVSFGRAAAGGVFSSDNRIAAYLNSRLASAAVRSLGGKIQLPEGVVKTIPVPVNLAPISGELVNWAVKLKERLISSNPTEAYFNPEEILLPKETALLEALILVCEGELERQVEMSVGLNRLESESLLERLGPVAAWFRPSVPLLEHPIFDSLPASYSGLLNSLNAGDANVTINSGRVPELDEVDRINKLSEIEKAIRPDWLFPSSGIIETVCRSFQIHPFDALLIVNKLLDSSGSFARDLIDRHIGVTLIAKLAKLLGHRWWSQSEISYDEVHLTLPFDTVSDLARQCIFKLEYRDDVSSELNLWADNCFEAWQDRVFLRESPFVFKKSGKSESQVSLGRVVVDQAS
jgi:hypothetical protein